MQIFHFADHHPEICVLVISELFFLFFVYPFDILFSHEMYLKAQEYEYEYGRSGDFIY